MYSKIKTCVCCVLLASTYGFAGTPSDEAKKCIQEKINYAGLYFQQTQVDQAKDKILAYAVEKCRQHFYSLVHGGKSTSPDQSPHLQDLIALGGIDKPENHEYKLFSELAFQNHKKSHSHKTDEKKSSFSTGSECSSVVNTEVLGAQNSDLNANLKAPLLKYLSDFSPQNIASIRTKDTRQQDLTLENMNKIYKDVLRGGITKVTIAYRHPNEGFPIESMTLSLSFQNKDEQPAGMAQVRLNGGDKTNPELTIEQIFVSDKTLRDGGIVARFLLANAEVLRLFNNKPEAKIKLYAWTGYEGGMGQEYGGYIWAPYGFDYAPPIFKPAYEELANKFIEWIKKCYGPDRKIDNINDNIRSGCSASILEPDPEMLLTHLTKEELDRLITKIHTWKHPWEMALFDTNQEFGRPVGKFFGKLGKEFMTHPNERVRWFGYLYINKENDSGLKQFYNHAREVLSKSNGTLLPTDTEEPPPVEVIMPRFHEETKTPEP